MAVGEGYRAGSWGASEAAGVRTRLAQPLPLSPLDLALAVAALSFRGYADWCVARLKGDLGRHPDFSPDSHLGAEAEDEARPIRPHLLDPWEGCSIREYAAVLLVREPGDSA